MAGEMGELIAQRRERRGMRQDELAARTRTSRRYISDVETGTKKHPVEPDILNGIAEALDIAVAELLTADGYNVFARLEEAERRKVAQAMTLADFIALKYNIEHPEQFAAGLETAIRGYAFMERQEKEEQKERDLYQHPALSSRGFDGGGEVAEEDDTEIPQAG